MPYITTYDDVVTAQKIQGDVIRKTSLTFSDTFTQLSGSTVYLKNEFEQKTGSFKLRGAHYKISILSKDGTSYMISNMVFSKIERRALAPVFRALASFTTSVNA